MPIRLLREIAWVVEPLVLGLAAIAAIAAFGAEPADGPLAPDAALGSFRVEPGLRLEQVAAEPLVESPCALAFDEKGRLFVAENRGYPTGPRPGEPPAGRIAELLDRDGDGRYDARVDFAAELTFPNGLFPWNGGWVVTCSPDVLFLADRDGDGRADERRVLYTGFDTKGSTQLRVSHPTLGLDNWCYLTSGLTGGKVIAPDAPQRPPVEVKRTDLRFRLHGGELEAADGGAQFGQSFDDFGRRFICYNRVQVQHVVLPSRWLRRNPHLAFSDTVENCPEMLPEPLKGHGTAARIFPISSNVTTADSHAGTFTAACAVTLYRGQSLPAEFRGGAFSCDPTGNLVHFDRLEPRGATFAARRVRDGAEVLASSDNWFRPVFLASGPDGALYVCDMYRRTIEHPDYLPVEIRKRTDFDAGKNRGRIYRLTGERWTARAVTLADASTDQLCDTLRDPDAWWRTTAQRLLLARRDPAAPARLRSLLGDASPWAAAHALWLLESFDALTADDLQHAARHGTPGVREQALLLAEPRVANEPALAGIVLAAADDADPRVRFVAAAVLGQVPDERALAALARIVARDHADRWLRAVVLSSLAGRESAFLDTWLAGVPAEEKTADFGYELGRVLGAGQPDASWPGLLERLSTAPHLPFAQQAALLTGVADGLRARGVARAKLTITPAVFAQAATVLRDVSQPEPLRFGATRLLAYATNGEHVPDLLTLLAAPEAPALQAAAVRSLAASPDERVTASLLSREQFASFTPRVRDEVLAALTSNPQHLPGLLSAIEQGVVPTVAIDTLRRRQLSQHRDPAIRARAEKLFDLSAAGDRRQVYEDHKAVLQLTADPQRGRDVFKRTCASCHRLDREGHTVGPDLFGIRNQPKEAILLHILVPDHEITQGFGAYSVLLKDGRVLTGLIASETPTSLTLRQPLGKEERLLRTDIEELVSSRLSLMPQGLEKSINRQEFADLLAYLKGEG